MKRPEAQIPSFRGSSLMYLSGHGGAIRVAGEVDLSNVEALQAVLDRERRRGGDLTLDLGALTFIDLAGMRALHRAALALGRDGHTLTLRSPPPLLTQVLAELELDAPTSMRMMPGGPPDDGARPPSGSPVAALAAPGLRRPRGGARAPASAPAPPPASRRPLVTRVARLLAARSAHHAGRPAGAR